MTAFMLAAQFGYFEIMSTLSNAGADVTMAQPQQVGRSIGVDCMPICTLCRLLYSP